MKRYIVLVFSLLLCGGFLSGHAYATTIDFTGLAGANDISVTSLTNIVGTDIPIQSVTISNAPNVSTNGSYLVTQGLLNFAYNGASNYINIYGNIPALLGIGSAEYLLQGTFSVGLGGTGTSGTTLTLGIGSDQKAADLLAAIGLPTDTTFQFAELTLSQDTDTGGYTAADVINVSAPEPSSLLLLGSGFIGLGLLARKRLQSVKG